MNAVFALARSTFGLAPEACSDCGHTHTDQTECRHPLGHGLNCPCASRVSLRNVLSLLFWLAGTGAALLIVGIAHLVRWAAQSLRELWLPPGSPVFSAVRSVLIRYGADAGTLRPSTLLATIGGETLTFRATVVDLEERFHIEIPDEAAAQMNTVQDLVDFIEQAKAE
jgi:hypothetical protein